MQKFAIRILSQTCSASGCERNWSVFERIHTKKRNRLEQQRLNVLVFVQYNLWLRRNQLLNRRPDTDPIVLDDIDPTSEWVEESQPAEFDPDDLGWMGLDQESDEPLVALPPSSQDTTGTSRTRATPRPRAAPVVADVPGDLDESESKPEAGDDIDEDDLEDPISSSGAEFDD